MLYGNCTDHRRESPYVPAFSCTERRGNFRPGHKILNNQRMLWWARLGLNQRPHPCEGRERSGASRCHRTEIDVPKYRDVRDLYIPYTITGASAHPTPGAPS